MTKKIKKQERARVDQPVNRIEFNRLQPAVENVPVTDASGASGSVHENENQSGSAGSYLSTPKRKSSGASGKKSFKLKSPKSAPAQAGADSTPKSKVKSSGKSGNSAGKKKVRKSPASAPAELGASLSDPESEGSCDSSVARSTAEAVERSLAAAGTGEELHGDPVVSKDGKELNFDSPFPCVDATDGKGHQERKLVVSKKIPICDEDREDFARFVREFDWEDHYWLHIRSSTARKLTLKYLRTMLPPCSYFEVEKFLQLSHIVHERFVAKDDGVPAEGTLCTGLCNWSTGD